MLLGSAGMRLAGFRGFGLSGHGSEGLGLWRHLGYYGGLKGYSSWKPIY